jgi:DNA-binding transcriptional LysR family regulator
MRFTFKQLRYFDAALRYGSIARAAEEMNISQSSITAAIDLMEGNIGTALFRRIPAKGIVATDAGREVGKRVVAFLEHCRHFESELMSLQGSPTGTLRVACFEPSAPYVLPPILKQISALYPSIRIDLKEGDMQEISQLLKDGGVDMALTYNVGLAADQPFRSLFFARPFALLPADWPLAAKPGLTLDDLADLPMLMLDLPASQSYFNRLFTSQGLRPKIVHTSKSSSVLRGMVAAGLGYTLMNIHNRGDAEYLSGYVTRPLLGDLEEPDFGLAYRAGNEKSAVLQAVLKISDDLVREGQFDSLELRPGIAG